MKIDLTKDQLDLLKSGYVLNTNEESYYYFPYWVKESDGKFELFKPEKLPDNIKNIINNQREGVFYKWKSKNTNKKKTEEKYYTPTIEEFHYGFDYEYLHKGEWFQFKCNFLNGEIELIDKKEIRVKYLDKQDIEILGWIESIIKTEYIFYDNSSPRKPLWGMYTDLKNNRIAIYKYGDIDSTPSPFSFYVKNKSELKRLMKQLNIA